MRDFFLKTKRIGFSIWNHTDSDLAVKLWGSKEVTRFICATGIFTKEDIQKRLETEIQNDKLYQIQYWPIFELETGELIGCCGIRPFKTETDPYADIRFSKSGNFVPRTKCRLKKSIFSTYELGFHLRQNFWGKGYAFEAAEAVINYSFDHLKADKLYAGHHPQNEASQKLLTRLGFHYIGKNFYAPTGLYHPSYELVNPNF